jgi:hypothetical protein
MRERLRLGRYGFAPKPRRLAQDSYLSHRDLGDLLAKLCEDVCGERHS